MKNNSFNEGHRQRLRERFFNVGVNGFADHEILELLLTYSISRKDCKQISKNLLDKYGNIYNLFVQSKIELETNKYIKDRTIVLFKLILGVINKEFYKKISIERISINNNKALLEYLSFNMLQNDIEVFKVIFLNAQNEVLKDENLFYGTIDRSVVYIRELLKKILEYKSKSIILVHNHPSGSLIPSQADISLTNKIKDLLYFLDVQLLDHIIVSEKGYFSFLEKGIL